MLRYVSFCLISPLSVVVANDFAQNNVTLLTAVCAGAWAINMMAVAYYLAKYRV
jgi:hypothetical protein